MMVYEIFCGVGMPVAGGMTVGSMSSPESLLLQEMRLNSKEIVRICLIKAIAGVKIRFYCCRFDKGILKSLAHSQIILYLLYL